MRVVPLGRIEVNAPPWRRSFAWKWRPDRWFPLSRPAQPTHFGNPHVAEPTPIAPPLIALAAVLLASAWGCALSRAIGPIPLHPHSLPPPRSRGNFTKRPCRLTSSSPPDILLVEAVNLVPKAPYRLRSSDVLTIQAQGTLPDSPISGSYVIEPGGQVNLGLPYG